MRAMLVRQGMSRGGGGGLGQTDRLGTTIHAYAVTAALAPPVAFRCFAPFAAVFAHGPLTVLADPRRTVWPGAFVGPVNGAHVRDTMAAAAGAVRKPGLVLRPDLPAFDLPAPRVALCPHAAERFKEWRPERWAALAEALLQSGLEVTAYPGHGRDSMPWPAGVREERLGLAALAAALATSTLVISVDSGPIHLADLVGVPTVGLYAATSPVTFGPYASREWCVDRHAEAFPMGMPYDTTRHIHGNAMDAVMVDTVMASVRRFFSPDR